MFLPRPGFTPPRPLEHCESNGLRERVKSAGSPPFPRVFRRAALRMMRWQCATIGKGFNRGEHGFWDQAAVIAGFSGRIEGAFDVSSSFGSRFTRSRFALPSCVCRAERSPRYHGPRCPAPLLPARPPFSSVCSQYAAGSESSLPKPRAGLVPAIPLCRVVPTRHKARIRQQFPKLIRKRSNPTKALLRFPGPRVNRLPRIIASGHCFSICPQRIRERHNHCPPGLAGRILRMIFRITSRTLVMLKSKLLILRLPEATNCCCWNPRTNADW